MKAETGSLVHLKMGKKPVKYYVVDAFSGSPFQGNQAAVCLLEEERDDKWLQAMAAEFNLPLTCYLTKIASSTFHLRWFTPIVEVEICGHATLAASHALFWSGLVSSDTVEFVTLSGVLTAKKLPELTKTRNGGGDCFSIEMDFPSRPTVEYISADVTASISKALNGLSIIDIRKTINKYHDILVVLPSWEAVVQCQPDFDEIVKCSGRGLIVTATAPNDSGFDFYSRFFFPKDAVCGSAHCALATYWGEKLGKLDLTSCAASVRGGTVKLQLEEKKQRVKLQGTAITVMEGSILV